MAKQVDIDRLPPANIEAEQAVLGGLLIDPDAITKVASFLQSDHFYREVHSLIYQAITELHEQGQIADFITLCNKLERAHQLEGVGGPGYITSLMNVPSSSAYVEHYGKIVKDLAFQRRLILLAGRIAAIGYEADPVGNGDVDTMFTEFSELIAAGQETGQIYTLAELEGIEAPEPLVERMLWRKNLIYGPPKGGKTRLATQLGIALALGKPFLDCAIPRSHRVLFVETDMDLPGYAQWAKRSQGNYQVTENIPFYVTDGRGVDLATAEGTAKLGQLLTQSRAEVLHLDCLRKLHSAEENSTTEMAQVLHRLDMLQDFHCLDGLDIIHHTRKLRSKEKLTPQHARGAGNLIDWCDSSLGLDGREGNIKARLIIEPRYAPKDERDLVFDWDVFRFEAVVEQMTPGTTMIEMLLRRHNGWLGRKDLILKLTSEGLPERTAERALRKMLEEGSAETRKTRERDPSAHFNAIDILLKRWSIPAIGRNQKTRNDEELHF